MKNFKKGITRCVGRAISDRMAREGLPWVVTEWRWNEMKAGAIQKLGRKAFKKGTERAKSLVQKQIVALRNIKPTLSSIISVGNGGEWALRDRWVLPGTLGVAQTMSDNYL